MCYQSLLGEIYFDGRPPAPLCPDQARWEAPLEVYLREAEQRFQEMIMSIFAKNLLECNTFTLSIILINL